MCSPSWMPRNRLYSGWLLHKPLATPPRFRYFTSSAMSPAPLSSPSDEWLPQAIAVYCGASPGTEPAFHHAAVCKTATLLFDFKENNIKFILFSAGESPRYARSAACIWRWFSGNYGHYLEHRPQPWWICHWCRPCCHAPSRRRGRADN